MRLPKLGGLLILLGALLPVAAAVWLFLGPVFLVRSVHVQLHAKGPAAQWSLEWQDKDGTPLNGAWLDLLSPVDEQFTAQVDFPLPNYAFARLALLWRGAPGIELLAPQPDVEERVLWWSFHPATVPLPDGILGTTRSGPSLTSTGPDGGVAWTLPLVTPAVVADGVLLYGVLAMGAVAAGAVFSLSQRGVRSRWYSAQRGALLLVVIVHTWMATRAPMLYCPDSMDYAVNAQQHIDTHSFAHFGAWRLPGYSIFLVPFMAGSEHYNLPLGIAQAVLGVLTAWLASRIVCKFLSPGWSALALLVVGLDPVLLEWERHAMPECLCAFLAVLIVWAALQRRVWADAWIGWAALAAMGLGVVIAGACFVRGNFQVFLLLMPLAAAAWALGQRQWGRAAVIACLILGAGAACLAPWLIHNHERYGRPELVVGSGYTQALSMTEAGVLDANQTSAFTPIEWNQLQKGLADGSVGSQELLARLRDLQSGDLAERTAGMHPWTALDERARAIAREAEARHPGPRWLLSAKAMGTLLGVYPFDVRGFAENEFWSHPLRGRADGGLNHAAPPAAYTHLDAARVQCVYDRTLEHTDSWARSDQAVCFDALFRWSRLTRPVWGVLSLLGVIFAACRRQWSLAIVGSIIIAHAGVLAVVLMTGIDRYQAPLFPLASVFCVYAVALLGGAMSKSADTSRTFQAR